MDAPNIQICLSDVTLLRVCRSATTERLPRAPAVGGFRDGRGEFYDTELYGGRNILVRFSIWPVSSNEVRAEQAFSVDGGTTWDQHLQPCWREMRRVKLPPSPHAQIYTRAKPATGIQNAFFLNDAYSSVGGLEFTPFRINTAKSGPASTCPVRGRFARSTTETLTRSRRRHRTLQSVGLVGNRAVVLSRLPCER